MFSITSAKVLGVPDVSGWTQVHDFEPTEEEKRKLRGHLFALISTSRSVAVGVDTVSQGREILSRLHEEYFGETEKSAFNALKLATKKVVNEFSKGEVKVEIAAAAFVEGVLYSAACGGGEVGVFRKASYSTILRPSGIDAIAASGYPQEGDLFILASSTFIEKIGKGILNASFSTGNLDNLVESLAPIVHSKEEMGNAGLAIIKFEKESAFPKVDGGAKPQKELPSEVSKGGKVRKISNAFGFLSKPIIRKRTFIKRKEVDVEDMRKRKNAFSVGMLLLIILAMSIGFGIYQKQRKEKLSVFNEKVTKARHNLEEAGELFSLSPERARQLFFESKTIVEELEGLGFDNEELKSLREEITKGRQSVLNEYDPKEELFLDLSLIADDFEASGLSTSEETIFVLDAKGKRVAQIGIESKKTEVIAGPAQIKDALALSSYEEKAFILEEDGIYEVGNEKKLAAAAEWENVLFGVYAANIYVLDKDASQVWRYSAFEGGFSDAQKWFAPGIQIDLSKIVSLAIDSSIWILSSSGKVEKYTRGSPESLAAFSASPPLVKPKEVFTNEVLDGVYILDPENSRILVLNKDGEYLAQYINEKLGSAIKFSVSESEGLIVFLEGNKLYSLSIGHR